MLSVQVVTLRALGSRPLLESPLVTFKIHWPTAKTVLNAIQVEAGRSRTLRKIMSTTPTEIFLEHIMIEGLAQQNVQLATKQTVILFDMRRSNTKVPAPAAMPQRELVNTET